MISKCNGDNCTAIDGIGHSPECQLQHRLLIESPVKVNDVAKRLRRHAQELVNHCTRISVQDEDNDNVEAFFITPTEEDWIREMRRRIANGILDASQIPVYDDTCET